MESITLADLARPDERILLTTPRAAGSADEDHAERAVARIQAMVADADLIAEVPEATRRNFDRLRALHTYGALCYDLFTVAGQQAVFVLEQALGERFIAYYGGQIPLVHEKHGSTTLSARDLPVAYQALNGGEYTRGWKLKLSGGAPLYFKGTLSHLFSWARREGLLHGQHNRHMEKLFVNIRNDVAHPVGFNLTWEVDSARWIWDLADLINRLWGATTPGGRLYSQPVEREVLAIAWDDNEGSSIGRIPGLPSWPEPLRHSVVLVLGNFDDPTLRDYNSRYETTAFPTELLWGPGTADQALKWLAREQPEPDRVQVLDRLFAVRVAEGQTDRPRSLEVSAGLMASQQPGEWYLVRADFPNDAFGHVLNSQNAQSTCGELGPCPVCAAETVAQGSLEAIITAAEAVTSTTVTPLSPPAVELPNHFGGLRPTASAKRAALSSPPEHLLGAQPSAD